jgi:hypothetical protein
MGSRYWAFTTGSGGTGPIVVLNHYSSETSGISPHQRWTTGILADNCSFPNAPINTQGIAYDNRGAGSGQGWTTGSSVAWNVITPYFLVSAAPGTENWCIGGVGQETTNSDPTGIYDSLGTQVTLGATGSLYLEQLRARLGTNALFNIGYYDYGTYKIQNVTSGLVLNQQGSLTNGSAITQWANVSSPNLEFTFIHTTNIGYYQINSVKSGLDVAVQGASTANGANLIQESFGSTGDDQWKPVQNSDGTLAFYNLNSGKVLNNSGGSLTNGTQYSQWTWENSPNEKFTLLPQ